MWRYDICFCERKECPRKDCCRHLSHAPVNIPFSLSRLCEDRYDECRWFYPGAYERYEGVKLNLNTATEEELLALGELGKVRVAGILAYRESHGGFQKVSELLKCRAMGKKTYDKIKEKVCVDG